MRYVKSFLVGLGMYLLAIAAWDVFVRLYLQVHWRHKVASGEASEVLIVAQPVFTLHSRWSDFYAMLPLIIGHVIGGAAFIGGFYWMFRRTSARNSN
jgi:formate/nitrite transporter FocA (FNT family)